MNIHLFGATTNTGRAMLRDPFFNKSNINFFAYSRKNTGVNYLELNNPDSFSLKNLDRESVFVSCSPIWIFANFIESLFEFDFKNIENLKAIIVCSSSSVVTKRFSYNGWDKNLYIKLLNAEDKIERICSRYKLNCIIIRPTIIYGNIGKHKDNNLSQIIEIMKLFPIIPFPSKSGLRQPIHISQLSELIIFYIKNYKNFSKEHSLKILVGGDKIFTYREMISLMQHSLPVKHPARNCKLVVIPSRIFYFLSSILIIFSPKIFSKILRIGTNLAPFEKSSDLLGKGSLIFPLPNYEK